MTSEAAKRARRNGFVIGGVVGGFIAVIAARFLYWYWLESGM